MSNSGDLKPGTNPPGVKDSLPEDKKIDIDDLFFPAEPRRKEIRTEDLFFPDWPGE